MRWSLKSLRAPSAALPAVLVALAAAPVAHASIVIGQSAAGVKLGATQAQVKTVLGPPETPIANEFFYSLPVGLRITFKHGRVQQILSYSKRQRTTKGITIGSTHAQLESAYPKATCQEGQNPPYVYCVVGARFQGRPSYTGFLFEAIAGPVVEVELGFGSVTEALRHP